MDKRWIEDAVVSTMSTATAIIIIINFVAGACHCPLRLRLSPWRGRQLIFMRSQNVCVCVCEVEPCCCHLSYGCASARAIFSPSFKQIAHVGSVAFYITEIHSFSLRYEFSRRIFSFTFDSRPHGDSFLHGCMHSLFALTNIQMNKRRR